MLFGDYFTYEIKSNKSGESPHCRCCSPSSPPPSEDLEHIITQCSAYSDIRMRIKSEYQVLCSQSKSKLDFQTIVSDSKSFCQFVLDPSSFNLTSRIHLNDPILGEVFKLSRHYCYAINQTRKIILNKLLKPNTDWGVMLNNIGWISLPDIIRSVWSRCWLRWNK